MNAPMEQFMQCVNYRVTEGSDFTWNCWGPNAYRLDSWSGDQDGHTVTIVFDTKTQVTYCVEAFDYSNNRAYRWMPTEYHDAYFAEAKQRNSDPCEAWDEVAFVDLETLEDFWSKASAIVAGEEYDTRVSVPLNLDRDQLHELMVMAHEQDITLNQLVERLLKEMIERHQLDLV